jgi:hypothetical protein
MRPEISRIRIEVQKMSSTRPIGRYKVENSECKQERGQHPESRPFFAVERTWDEFAALANPRLDKKKALRAAMSVEGAGRRGILIEARVVSSQYLAIFRPPSAGRGTTQLQAEVSISISTRTAAIQSN